MTMFGWIKIRPYERGLVLVDGEPVRALAPGWRFVREVWRPLTDVRVANYPCSQEERTKTRRSRIAGQTCGAPTLRASGVGDSQGHFIGYFLWGLAKKVSRLPAGTGELDVRIVSFCTQHSKFNLDFMTAGPRPRPAPYFLSKPTKSKQKMASPAGGMWSRWAADFTTIVPIHPAAGFLGLFLLRGLMA
jgi:hypothetical protein